MDNIEIESHKNEVINMKGEVQSTSVHLSIRKERSGKRPNSCDSALLQARHVFNEFEDITDEVKELGYDTGDSYLVNDKHRLIKIHYYAWGLFCQTIQTSLKDRTDLKDWSPDLFAYDIPCEECNATGKLPYKVGSEEYNEAFEGFESFNKQCRSSMSEEELKTTKPFQYGDFIGTSCKKCSGIGFVFDREKYQQGQK